MPHYKAHINHIGGKILRVSVFVPNVTYRVFEPRSAGADPGFQVRGAHLK